MTLLEFYDAAGQKLQPVSAVESGSALGDIDGSWGATGLIFHGKLWGGRPDASGQFWVGGDWGNVAVAVSYVLLSQRGPNHRKSLGTIESFDATTGAWAAASPALPLCSDSSSCRLDSLPLPPSPPSPPQPSPPSPSPPPPSPLPPSSD